MTTIPFHSPSSVGYECDYAWALRYLEGIKMPEVPWDDFASGKVTVAKWGTIPGPSEAWAIQRSAALGKEMHRRWELYYGPAQGKGIVWTDLIGQIMNSGRHLLPRRDHCTTIKVEEPIGTRNLKWTRRGDARENTVWDLDGIAWNGYKDLLIRITRDECERLGCYWTDGYLLIDHKTTSSIAQYAKVNAKLRVANDDRTDLKDDLQCCLYALEVMQRYGLTALAVRWVYYETKAKRQAIAVDELITIEHARKVVANGRERAIHLARIRSLSGAKYNTRACTSYGGCKYHVEYGGPCTARRPLGALVNGSRKKVNREALMNIAELRKKAAEKAKEIKSEPPPAAEVESGAEAEETPKPKLSRGRKPAAAKVEVRALPEPESEVEDNEDIERAVSADASLESWVARRAELLLELAEVNAAIIAEVSR